MTPSSKLVGDIVVSWNKCLLLLLLFPHSLRFPKCELISAKGIQISKTINFRMKLSMSDHCGKVIVLACWWNSSVLVGTNASCFRNFFHVHSIPHTQSVSIFCRKHFNLLVQTISKFLISYQCGKEIVVACWWNSGVLVGTNASHFPAFLHSFHSPYPMSEHMVPEAP